MSATPWIGGCFLILIVIISLTGGDDKKESAGTATADATQAAPDAPAEAEKPPSKLQQTKAALKDEFGDQLADVERVGRGLMIQIHAADNFSNGMIKSGIRMDAQTAFEIVYDKAGYSPRMTLVTFDFPLVNTKTGKEYQGNVAVYALSRAQAEQISWDNADAIDWDSYRTMLSPVLD